MNLPEVGRIASAVVDEVEKAVVGKRDALELLLLGLLADGHVLLEDYPGLAKTLMARSFAQVCSMDFSRIQFTPDLMPSDVTGSSVYNQRDADFQFRPGPIFANLLLADEINRAPPKTQAALLEAMQERQVTTEGVTRRLGPPFLVMATQNPIEYEGTYPLPEAQLDRFLLRMSVGYPEREDEWRLLAERAERRTDEVQLSPVVDRDTLLAMQLACEDVFVSEPVGLYMVDVVAATRSAPSIQVGASPRGSLALMKLSRCRAALDGRDYVTPDDVKASRCPRSLTASRCAPSSGCSGSPPKTWCGSASRPSPHRSPRTSPARDAASDLEARRIRSAVGVRARRGTRARTARDRRADGAVPARGRRRARARRLAAVHGRDRRGRARRRGRRGRRADHARRVSGRRPPRRLREPAVRPRDHERAPGTEPAARARRAARARA